MSWCLICHAISSAAPRRHESHYLRGSGCSDADSSVLGISVCPGLPLRSDANTYKACVKRAPLRLRDVRSRILPRRWNCDYGRIADIALALSEAEYLIEHCSLVPQRRNRWCLLCMIDAPFEVFS